MDRLKFNTEFGGNSKNDLLKKLNEFDVLLNDFAKIIFLNELFQTSTSKKTIFIEELSIKELGFTEGANNSEIRKTIKKLGLGYCPLELGPYLRLTVTNQNEVSSDLNLINQSPLDAITIFSKPIIEDDSFPKGFYLRKIENRLWLRGYTCTDEHIWKPSDRMVFKVLK